MDVFRKYTIVSSEKSNTETRIGFGVLSVYIDIYVPFQL